MKIENNINIDEIPRRYIVEENTPAELAIFIAIREVENLAANEKLTEAVMLLTEAKELVGDYVDNTNKLYNLNNIINYAKKCHEETNHFYDDLPYEYHLKMVEGYAKKYIHIFDVKYHDIIIAGCWVHDLLEDTRETYNDVTKICGERVADISFALQNNKGKTRKDRANADYYEGIKKDEIAHFVKICDRLANITYSKNSGSSMFKKYKQEFVEFKTQLYDEKFHEMFIDMLNLFRKTEESKIII